MLILVTNDDGIHASGINALASRLAELGRVVVVAPDRERSAAGHSLTLHSPLRAEQLDADRYAVDGTPTDCVTLGIHGLLNEKPDLVVSGINHGSNLGDDLTYSGTVAAAFEATLMGVPSLAISLETGSDAQPDFSQAADVAVLMAREVMMHELPNDTFLNINVPPGKPHGLRLTRQGKRVYGDAIVEKHDPRGRKYYWIGGGELGFEDIEGTDFNAVAKGYVSVTPLHLDLTNYRSFERLHAWRLEEHHFSEDVTEGTE